MKNTKLLFFAFLMLLMGHPHQYLNAQTIGAEAPNFELQTLDGETFKLADHKGKVVFVFLFGSRCSHCQANAPNTQSAIYEVYKANPNFVAVGIDTWDGTKATVNSFKTRTGLTYPICLNGSAVESSFSTTYDRMLVIDADGILRYKSTANATSPIVSQASEVIDTWLANSTGIFDFAQEKNGVEIYPNPTQGNTTIRLSGTSSKVTRINILDINGKTHHTIPENSQANEAIALQLDHLSSGLYIVQIHTQHGTFNRRLVINNGW